MKTSLLNLVLFSSLNVWAQCDKYDYYAAPEKLNETSENIQVTNNNENLSTVRNQDSIGWCYSYSSADLYEDWLKENNKIPNDQSISPFGIALGYETNDDADKNTERFSNLRARNNERFQRDENIIETRERLSGFYDEKDALNGLIESRKEQLFNEDPLVQRYQQEKNELRSLMTNNIPEGSENLYEKYELSSPLSPSDLAEIQALLAQKDLSISNQRRYLEDNDEDLLVMLRDLNNLNNLIDETNNNLNNYIALEINSDGLKFPTGGHAEDAIESAYKDYICLESEVNSRNTNFKDIIEKYSDQYLYLNNADPNNIDNIMMELYRLNGKGQYMEYCAKEALINTLFPAYEGELSELIRSFDMQFGTKEFFKGLIDENCKANNNLTIEKPKIKKYYAGEFKFPINDTKAEIVTDLIDEALEKGRIAEISYMASIFSNKDGEGSDSSYHSSVITGKANICGEEHYILRNSWGPGACERGMDSFKAEPVDYESEDNIFSQLMVCQNTVQTTYETDLLECNEGDFECTQKAFEKYDSDYQSCDHKFQKQHISQKELPYFCNEDGDYIISKSHFKKGTYSASFINN